MNIAEVEQIGEVEAIKLGYSPVGPPLMSVYMYIIDGLLIDTGQGHMRKRVIQLLEGKNLQQIVLTHHHEDHSGNAAAIGRQHNIQTFGHPLTAAKMASDFRILPYQHLIWGKSEKTALLPLDRDIETNRHRLEPVHTPGHSKDHMVFWDAANGRLYSGDLYLGRRIKYFRTDEYIFDQIDSLKKVLELDFDALFCAHNPCRKNGKSKLRQKLQFLEDITGQVQEFKNRGMELKTIVKHMDSGKDRWVKLMTLGNVSFANMLRSAYRSNGV